MFSKKRFFRDMIDLLYSLTDEEIQHRMVYIGYMKQQLRYLELKNEIYVFIMEHNVILDFD
jgi:hypothetical protein